MNRWDRTHSALRRTALELFASVGYDAAGTARIAELAGVSEMTLFRHFPTKEALLLADPFDPIMAEAVRSRSGDETAMQALLGGIGEAWQRIDDEEIRALRVVLSVVAATPSLSGAIVRSSNETATALEEALGDRGVSSAQAQIAVAAVIAGLSAALLHWARSEVAEDPNESESVVRSSLDAAAAEAFAVLGGPLRRRAERHDR